MRKLITIILILVCSKSFAQVYQLMPQYGYQANRFVFDSTLQIPTTCGVPTLKSVQFTTRRAAIAFDSCNNRFYQYNPKTLAWSVVSGGGGSTDTTSLSNRINLKIDSLKRRRDSVFAYRNGTEVFQFKDSIGGGGSTDTTSLSTRIDARVKYTDTASMLSNYLTIADTTNQFVNSVTKVNDSTIRVIKGTSTTDITITTSSVVTAATRLVTSVYNNSGSTIAKGSVVYISGRHSSNLPTIALAQANSEENSYKTFALVSDDIADNASGLVIQAGNIGGLNLPTASFTDGDIVYLSPTSAGGLTTTKPLAPNHICKIGSITRAHPTLGSIEIKIENGWQLDELSDVSIPLVPADSVLLQFSRVDSLWHDVTITNAIGSRYIKPSDTASMLSNYLTTADTTSLQQKSLPANSIVGNATYQTANAQSIYFKDTSGTYTGTITWTATTAPSGTTNHSYRWTRIGNLVNLNIALVFSVAGGSVSQVVLTLPADAPTPAKPAGLTAASNTLYPVNYQFVANISANPPNATQRSILRSNAANNGFEIVALNTSTTVIATYFTIQYTAQ